MTRVIRPTTPIQTNHKVQFSINQMFYDEIEKRILIIQKDFKK